MPDCTSDRLHVLLATALFALAACRATPVDFATSDAIIERRVGRERSWGAQPIASELRELVDQLEAGAAGDAPAHIAIPLHVGEDALAARLHLMRSARRSIDLQVYVWADDLAGQVVLREAYQAARRGVRVRILVDQLAVRENGLGATLALAHEKLEFSFYNPVKEFSSLAGYDLTRDALRRFDRLNERMHNKVLVVDRELALVGGRNIAESYFDLDREFIYLDRDLLVAGPVVAEVAASFDAYWDDPISVPAARLESIARDVLRFEAAPREIAFDQERLAPLDWMSARAGVRELATVLPHSTLHRVGRVEFEADRAQKDGFYDWNTWKRPAGPSEEAFAGATESVILQSNYLVLMPSSETNLVAMMARAPKVQYLTNSFASTANLLTYSASRKRKRYLLGQGLDLRELRSDPGGVRHFVPRFDALCEVDEDGSVLASPVIAIHAKSAVIDDEASIIGSHNMDPRSQLYNTEAWFVVWDEGLTRELRAELELAMSDDNAWVGHLIDPLPVWDDLNAVLGGVSRALPILDVWPWFGYAMFELRDGAEPVPASSPDFFERYRRVGEMPAEGSTWKRWKVRLLTTVIAPFRRLL